MTPTLAHIQANIRTSFARNVEVQKGKTYQFHGDTPHATLFEENANFWAYGLAFYATAKIMDQHSLIQFANSPRNILEHTILLWRRGGMTMPIFHYYEPYDSVQYEHLFGLANRDRVILEHIVALNISHAIELILKAIKAHASKAESGNWTFYGGHDLHKLYTQIDSDLRDELEEEFLVFTKKHKEHVNKMKEILDGFRAETLTVTDWADAINHVIDDLNSGGYTHIRGGADSGALDLDAPHDINSLEDAIKKIPSIATNRYGPESGPDSYPPAYVTVGLIIGRFFYEHLFPPPLPTEDSFMSPLMHWLNWWPE